MRKATVKFGFRPYFLISCLTQKKSETLVEEVCNIMEKVLKTKMERKRDWFCTSSFGVESSNIHFSINLDRYLTIQEQNQIIKILKDHKYSFSPID